MGSFNLKCALSNQTVLPKAKVKVLVISHQQGYSNVELTDGFAPQRTPYNSIVGPTSFWEPVSPFLDAVYDDYGLVTLLDTEDNKHAFNQLCRALLYTIPSTANSENEADQAFDFIALIQKRAPGFYDSFYAGNDTEDLSLTVETMNLIWLEVNEQIRQGRIFIKDWQLGEQPRALALSVIHHAAFTNLIEIGEVTKQSWEMSYKRQGFIKRKMEEAIINIKPDDPYQVFHLADQVRDIARLNCSDRFGKLVLGFGKKIHETARKLIEGGSIDEAFHGLTALLDAMYIRRGMTELEIQLMPSSYANDCDNEAGRLYAKFIHKTSKAVTQEDKERYE